MGLNIVKLISWDWLQLVRIGAGDRVMRTADALGTRWHTACCLVGRGGDKPATTPRVVIHENSNCAPGTDTEHQL